MGRRVDWDSVGTSEEGYFRVSNCHSVHQDTQTLYVDGSSSLAQLFEGLHHGG